MELLSSPSFAEFGEKIKSRRWRLSNLYKIRSKNGDEISFSPNWAQSQLLSNLHNLNIILKARQLGVTTLFSIMWLDACLWYDNIRAGLITDRLETSQEVFRDKVKYAYDRLPEFIKVLKPCSQENIRQLSFENGSTLGVSTSIRAGTYQMLHISEFGKICAENPTLSKEIVEGSLNAVSTGQLVTIESTAQGRSGYFYDFYKKAQQNFQENTNLTCMDMKPFFFPWWKEPGYALYDEVFIPKELEEYFKKLKEDHQIFLNDYQKFWYSKKYEIMEQGMLQEYPSTPEEAFWVSNQGLFFAKEMSQIHHDGRITQVSYNENLPVYTGWDLGFHDYTVVWFAQCDGPFVKCIDFLMGSDEGLEYYVRKIKEKPYTYAKHFLPHDVNSNDVGAGITRFKTFTGLGLTPTPMARRPKEESVELIRKTLKSTWFDKQKCGAGIRFLESYRREWDYRLGCYRSSEVHDESSHASSAFAELSAGLSVSKDLKGMTYEQVKALKTQQKRWY